MKILGKIKEFFKHIFNRERGYQTIAGLAFIFFVWFAVFGEQGLYQLHKTTNLKYKLKKDIAAMEDQIVELKRHKDLLQNPDHLELVIRQELGYVKNGEYVFGMMKEGE